MTTFGQLLVAVLAATVVAIAVCAPSPAAVAGPSVSCQPDRCTAMPLVSTLKPEVP